MSEVTHLTSLSVYRGQARMGVGEGPGKEILHGEQYLQVDPELFDNELLDLIRPWLTLDSDPADHQRLGEQLESWSLFAVRRYLFVVRLAPASVYDRRAAYFAHGRAWNGDAVPGGIDPGLHLGRSEAFDAPWRDELPPSRAPETPPSLVRPQQIASEPDTAARYLGSLYQALSEERSLIIAAPTSEFVTGSPLHALVSMARAGLPTELRCECRIRVYTRSPDRFLRHLRANLVVVPEDAAGTALSADPTATLLDRRGDKRAGPNLDPRALAYATAVVKRAVGIPDGVSAFAHRFRTAAPRELPTAAETRRVQIIYNIAFAFAGPPQHRAELLHDYLPRIAEKLGPGLPWSELIADEEWEKFPAEAVADQLLATASDASEGGAEFVAALQAAAARLGLNVDDRVAAWWDSMDPRKVRRLVSLIAHDPPLITPALVVELTSSIPLSQLSEAGRLDRVLALEADAGLLSIRAAEKSELASAARDGDVFDVLTSAVEQGRLDSGWAPLYIASAPFDELAERGSRWLATATFFQAWGNVPELLLDRFRTAPDWPVTFAETMQSAIGQLDPVAQFESYVRLADLVVRISPEAADAVQPLWDAVPHLSDAQRQRLEERLLDSAWPGIDVRHIRTRALVNLAAMARPDTEMLLHAELDARMREAPEATTRALVQEQWWYFWRSRSRLTRDDVSDSNALQASAFAWLRSHAKTKEKDVPFEAWRAAMEDLPKKFSDSDIAELRWPRIPLFEDDQLADLVPRCADLGALADLCQTFPPDWPDSDRPRHAVVLNHSTLQRTLDDNALAWLVDRSPQLSKPALDLNQSRYLYEHSGRRKPQGLAARVESVAAHLRVDPDAALEAAGKPDLWSEPSFLNRLADWMNRQGSVAQIGIDNAKRIDTRVAGSATVTPDNASRELVRDLMESGFRKAARLVDSGYQHQMELDQITLAVCDALLHRRGSDDCWRRLAESIAGATTSDGMHPLRALADRIRTTVEPSDRTNLARHGWTVFRSAADEHPTLRYPMDDFPSPEAPMLPLLDFAASMLGPGSLGTAVLQLAFTVRQAGWRENMRLWQSLLRAVRAFTSHGNPQSADDRQEVVVALLFAALDGDRERDALTRAMKHMNDDWPLPAEFGVVA